MKTAREQEFLRSLRPRRKPRNVFLDTRATALVQAVLAVLNALPAPAARWLGRRAGGLFWRIDRRHRQQVLRHMEIAFRGEKPRAEKEELCRRYFEHIGLAVVEFARMTQITRENLDELIDLRELKVFDALLARGQGLLCVPAHHGNWELCGYVVALQGYALKSVARPLDNASLDALVTEIREHSGNEIIQKYKVLWKLKKLLDKGGIVTLTVDQNGGLAGHFVPFFGVLASTLSSPADLHLATGAPLVVATLNRLPDGVHHVLRIWDVIERTASGDHEADVKAVLTRINAATEKAIREYPEQWLWVHKRWKTRPPGESASTDGLPPVWRELC